jgi:hypothetical protein
VEIVCVHLLVVDMWDGLRHTWYTVDRDVCSCLHGCRLGKRRRYYAERQRRANNTALEYEQQGVQAQVLVNMTAWTSPSHNKSLQAR